jgi:hypothetical protein
MTEAYQDIPTSTEQPSSTVPDQHTLVAPHFRILATAHWLQNKLSQLISQLHLLSITRGRSLRWRHLCRQLAQAGVALLLAVGVVPLSSAAWALSPLTPPSQAEAANTHAMPAGSLNPLDGVDVGFNSTPCFVDLDGDGDLDAFIGEADGYLNYFENTGDAINPAFLERTDTLNPLDGLDVTENSAPCFIDLDGDGDMDVFIGEADGYINYFKNIGNATNPDFARRVGSLNPLNSVDVEYDSIPSFADLDGDGDLDAFIGERYGMIKYFRNTGSATNPAFIELTGSLNPLKDVDVMYNSAPNFADLDGDGDLDAFTGDLIGTIAYFENTGSATSPAMINRSFNPFNGIDVGFLSTPSVADLDGDGDLDTFIGEYYGTIQYIENTHGTPKQFFIQRSGSLNPLNFVDVGLYSKPSFADLDKDGDLDAFIGENDRYINYFENIGSATNPAFVERTGSQNPLPGLNTIWNSAPSFADLDGDGDLDAFSGEFYGTIIYFENTGNATNPAFIERTGSPNPFYGYDIGQNSTPSFADLDADGDLDTFIGEYEGIINYFENTGSATSPAMTMRSGTRNPIDFVDVGTNSAPCFAELDKDGDLDLFSGEKYGTTQYFQNIHNATVPIFVQRTDSRNPLNGMNVPSESTPSFADLDADGDLDAFIGESDGIIKYFENILLLTHLNFPLVVR